MPRAGLTNSLSISASWRTATAPPPGMGAALMPAAAYHELEGVGHLPPVEAPDRVLEAIATVAFPDSAHDGAAPATAAASV